MLPWANKVKVCGHVQGRSINTDNFAFQVTVTLNLEITCPDGYVDRIGLNGAPWPLGYNSKESLGFNQCD